MTVKFSNGPSNWLAAGGDDHMVLIYELVQDRPATTAFGEKDINVENWRLVKTLAGHTSDVTSVVWTQHDKHLISGSLDSTIHIWQNLQGTFGIKSWFPHVSYFYTMALYHPRNVRSADNFLNMNAKIKRIFGYENSAKMRVLKEHTGFVKGLAIDPTGQYLASQVF